MKDQVMKINSVQKSSKSELSSGIFGHFKVWKKSQKIVLSRTVNYFFNLCIFASIRDHKGMINPMNPFREGEFDDWGRHSCPRCLAMDF